VQTVLMSPRRLEQLEVKVVDRKISSFSPDPSNKEPHHLGGGSEALLARLIAHHNGY
jgi:hypothetical protein